MRGNLKEKNYWKKIKTEFSKHRWKIKNFGTWTEWIVEKDGEKKYTTDVLLFGSNEETEIYVLHYYGYYRFKQEAIKNRTFYWKRFFFKSKLINIRINLFGKDETKRKYDLNLKLQKI